jgi:diguanylate cyclase
MHSLFSRLLGSDVGVRHLLLYWAIGFALYIVGLAMLWAQVMLGEMRAPVVVGLSAAAMLGAAAAFVAIRFSRAMKLSPASINITQSLWAIGVVLGAYTQLGSMRAIALSIPIVILVFGGFAATPRQLRAMCAATVVAMGATMFAMSHIDPQRYPPQEEAVNLMMATALLVAVTYLAETLSRLRRSLKRRTEELASALTRIQDMATHDELTQLANRRQMLQTLEEEAQRRDRSGEPLCIAVIDLDYFKRINDTLGHAAGDTVLRQFAERALACLRRSDLLARWGGEEFLLLLPRTSIEAAQSVLERMRAQPGVAPGDPATAMRVTFSAGLAASPAGEDVELAIERADKAMYRAKREGRDRIARASAPRLRGASELFARAVPVAVEASPSTPDSLVQ